MSWKKTDKVCVVGLGTVGLPTALHASKFFDVVGYDIDPRAVERAKSFGLSATWEEMPYAAVFVIAVNTSIRPDNSPDMSNIYEVSSKISKLKREGLICIESTVAMGTCRSVAEKFHLTRVVHCPHRFWSEDTINHGVVQTRVFGALNEESHEMGRRFYERQKIPIKEVSSIEVAEMSKVAENAYRFVQIAFAEELKMICDHVGLPFEKVREACNTKWNIEILEARDGIGGDCLPKDIRYLWSIMNSSLLKGAINTDEIYKSAKKREKK